MCIPSLGLELKGDKGGWGKVLEGSENVFCWRIASWVSFILDQEWDWVYEALIYIKITRFVWGVVL